MGYKGTNSNHPLVTPTRAITLLGALLFGAVSYCHSAEPSRTDPAPLDAVNWVAWHINHIDRHFRFNYESTTWVTAGADEKHLTSANHRFSGSGEFWKGGFDVQQTHQFGMTEQSVRDYQAAGSFETNSGYRNWAFQSDALMQSAGSRQRILWDSIPMDDPVAMQAQSFGERLMLLSAFYLPLGLNTTAAVRGREMMVQRDDRNLIPRNGSTSKMGRVSASLAIVDSGRDFARFRIKSARESQREIRIEFKRDRAGHLVPHQLEYRDVQGNAETLLDKVKFLEWSEVESPAPLEIYRRISGQTNQMISLSFTNGTYSGRVGTNDVVVRNETASTTTPRILMFLLAIATVTLAAVLAKTKLKE